MVSLKLNQDDVERIINNILGRLAFLIQREIIFRLPVSFKNKITVAKEGAAWLIGSNDEILRYYILGTKPHVIRPKSKSALAFSWPGAPVSPTSPSSGMWVYKKVNHPGTKGNNILEDIENDEALLRKLLDEAIKGAIK